MFMRLHFEETNEVPDDREIENRFSLNSGNFR